MPYKSEYTHKKIPKELDRRIKLTDEQREEIKILFAQGYSKRWLGIKFWVDRKTIRNIVEPEFYQVQLKKYKELKWSSRYYNKDTHREAIKNTRRYRVKIELVDNK